MDDSLWPVTVDIPGKCVSYLGLREPLRVIGMEVWQGMSRNKSWKEVLGGNEKVRQVAVG